MSHIIYIYNKSMSMNSSKIDYFYIKTPCVSMRKQPSDLNEVVSQAIFSEEVHLLEQLGEWSKIATAIDSYSGWVKSSAIYASKVKYSESNQKIAFVNRNAAHLYHVPDTIFGPILTLPYESCLQLNDQALEDTTRWLKVVLPDNQEAYIQRGDISFKRNQFNDFSELKAFSRRFFDLPYTWGGRSSFGYDCSGFVQMLYRHVGIYLPRDSIDQCHWEGFVEVPIEDAKLGDLIFFGSNVDKIWHVGMCDGERNFIHATVQQNMPYIRQSSLDEAEWCKYSFRTVRRCKC